MSKKILIVGESCRDIFMYCDTHRIAPDMPVPVLHVTGTSENPGMAKNVERNIRALGGDCDLVTNDNWRKITKTRYVHDKTIQAFFRVDTPQPMDRIDVRMLPLDKYDIVAISDYNKGFLTDDDVRYLCDTHPAVFIDTKKPIGSFLKNAAFIKINQSEYERSLPIAPAIAKKIICTKGADGAEYRGVTYPVPNVEVRDSCGAGDTFFAALLVRYAETGDIINAIAFANECATEVVQKKGVSVVHKARLSARRVPAT